MPTAMTFTNLQEDVRGYIERGGVSDPTVFAQLPRLINLAERSIAERLKILGFVNVVTANLVAGTSVYAKPDRWRETISMVCQNVRTPLFARSYEYARSYWPDPAQRATPEFYSDYNYENWLIVPTPIATIPWEILYYQQPPLLDAANQTNWLTDFAPSALLFRSLIETYAFLKDTARMAEVQPLYEEAVGRLSVNDIKKVVDRNVTRQGA